MDLHIEASGLTGSLDHRLKAAPRERRPAFADEYERGFGLLLALQAAKSPQLSPGQGMRRRTAVLESTDVQERVIEIDLIPPKVNQLRHA
jgi:hypothetical protein